MVLLKRAISSIQTDGVISIATAAQDSTVEIKIADSGEPIPADELEHLFDISLESGHDLVQSEMSYYSINCIIKRQNGSIDVASNPNTGTTFTINCWFNQIPIINLPGRRHLQR
ncbi:hypothetical protein JW960_07710 [candidate division KSB1 bacterium]|nr:hypothetical protein [candidate division KSB1 bacterium]